MAFWFGVVSCFFGSVRVAGRSVDRSFLYDRETGIRSGDIIRVRGKTESLRHNTASNVFLGICSTKDNSKNLKEAGNQMNRFEKPRDIFHFWKLPVCLQLNLRFSWGILSGPFATNDKPFAFTCKDVQATLCPLSQHVCGSKKGNLRASLPAEVACCLKRQVFLTFNLSDRPAYLFTCVVRK